MSRGPNNIGGRTRALAIDMADSRVVIAGGITGGMWRSTDRGASWRRTTTKSQMPSVTCVAQDPRQGHQHVWYYGTGEGRTNSTRFGNVGLLGDGIFRSVDSGKSWEPLMETISGTPQTLDSPFDIVWDIAIDPHASGPGTLYVAGASRVVRSTDGGDSWSVSLRDETSGPGYTAVTVSETGVAYAGIAGGTLKGIWRSDNGTNWVKISPAIWPDSMRRIVLALAPSDQNTLYVACESPGFGLVTDGSYGFDEYYSLWRYHYLHGDGSGNGGSWDDRSDNIPQLGGGWDFNGLNSYTLLLKVRPDSADVVYLGGTNLYRSDDGFATDARTVWLGGYGRNGGYGGPGQLHPDQHALVFVPDDPTMLLSGSDGGVATAVDRATGQLDWSPLTEGYVTTQFYTIALDHETPQSPLLVGGLQDNGTPLTTTREVDEPWSDLFGGDGSFCAFADAGRTIYVSSQYGRIHRIRLNDDFGAEDYARIDPLGAAGYLFVAPFALDPNDRRTMYLPVGATLWRNSNLDDIPLGGGTRPQTNWSQFPAAPASQTLSAIGVSTSSPPHRVYLGTSQGHLYRVDNARSLTPTPSQEITDAAFPAGGYINCIAVDPDDGDNALVVFTNYGVQSLFYTSDAGSTWSAVGGNLEEYPDGSGRGPSCRWAAIGTHDGSRYLFVGTTVGLFSTTVLDGDNTEWALEGDETIGYVRVDMIDFRTSDGVVAAATWGNGVYTTTLPTSEVPGRSEPRFTLTAMPNPTRGITEFRFSLPAPAVASLSVYDATGRCVARPLDRRLQEGEQSIAFDASTLSKGIYFYALRAGERTTGGRLVVR